MGPRNLHSARLPLLTFAVLAAFAVATERVSAQQLIEGSARFDWDLISLEQNNSRFNGSVLSGFHSVRSPGVTPAGAWKTGLGILYSHEEQTATAGGVQRSLETDRVTINPKLNFGLYDVVELGAGAEFVYVDGTTAETGGGGLEEERDDNLNISAAVIGIKWGFYRDNRLRLATAFDSRIAMQSDQFGMLPETLYNIEIDGDYAFTSRFSLVGNLQFMTSDSSDIDDQVIFDLAGNYTFSEEFRGMLFGTVQEDDEADDAVFFIGFAGQYVLEVHSFTLALDFQLNDADREVRTESQIDLEFSYTFTF